METTSLQNSNGVLDRGENSSLRPAGKRAPQAEETEKNRKRAAFEDITNAKNGGVEASCNGQVGFAQSYKNPVYSSGSQDALAQRMGSVGLETSYALPTQVYGGGPCDIDVPELGDHLACAEVANDIFANLRKAETRRRPATNYMEVVQADINPLMRSILVDWLVEVGQEYRMCSDTLYLAVAYVDRYLSVRAVPRSQLQLVGVAAMWVASKYEEIYPPSVDDYAYITDHTYSRGQLAGAERDLLAALRFDLTQPTAKTFLRRYVKAAAAELDLAYAFEPLASYLAELSLLDYSALGYLPSMLAASAVLLALVTLEHRPWTATLAHYTGYAPKDLRHCVQALHELALAAPASQLPATREKYSSTKQMGVARIALPATLPDWIFQ
ncbi:Cyclin-A1-1 [Auxenochlorella protothecoides]|uniref:Cyclin-A1-1 n=1 Tax=Auxenochlorella protothecoides TaxID=3075 RepID=A0A087SRZ2_AUXPR|nr:Cyclin-A1-1 [Auxenochlorella protothecoides]KFM28496.1 Cyclin-A1-1 [Auxenochlorella protothecoides]RMZ55472.1 hypothetical protein APUTEX25_000055 [Auxenochlorella protothecoides]|eukprot:RMZ55472.1 hypothetical protein APUTEX25_000055 [Auxenochlorella protothecoides]